MTRLNAAFGRVGGFGGLESKISKASKWPSPVGDVAGKAFYEASPVSRRCNAHAFLPGSGSSKKDGTFIDAERRIGMVRRIMQPRNGYADWEIKPMGAECG